MIARILYQVPDIPLRIVDISLLRLLKQNVLIWFEIARTRFMVSKRPISHRHSRALGMWDLRKTTFVFVNYDYKCQ